MSFVHDEFKDYLLKIADELQRDDYRSVIKSHLGASLDEIERAKINCACKRLMSVVGGDVRDEFIDNFQKRIEKRRKIEKKYGKELVSRQDAIDYTEQSESNFDKLVREKKFIKDRNGKLGFRIEDLKEIAKAITLESNKLVICLENSIYVDKETREIVPFEKDKIYKIINENKIWITLFNAKLEQTARFSAKKFRKFFRNAEDWEIDQIKFNLNDLS